MAIFPGPDKSVFWFDFESMTNDNRWVDSGPYGLHATPQAGFTAPNYGLAKNAHGKGYANFTGAANVYATLPTRYYNYAPPRTCTFVGAYSNLTDKNQRIFSSWDEVAGNYRGQLLTLAQAVRSSYVYQFKNDATLPVNTTSTAAWSLYDTKVVIHSIDTAGSAWSNRVGLTTSWAVGAFGTTSYNTTIAPTIGKMVVTNDYTVGRILFLAQFPFAFTDSEARAMSAWLMDRV